MNREIPQNTCVWPLMGWTSPKPASHTSPDRTRAANTMCPWHHATWQGSVHLHNNRRPAIRQQFDMKCPHAHIGQPREKTFRKHAGNSRSTI